MKDSFTCATRLPRCPARLRNKISFFPWLKIDEAFGVGVHFFSLPLSDKQKYSRVGNDNNGYVGLEIERYYNEYC